MDRLSALKIISAIEQGLKENPTQFNINISANVTGQNISSHGSGPGAIITTHGGAAGSSVVGNMVTTKTDTGSVDIVFTAARGAMDDNVKALIEQVESIRSELEKETPNYGFIRSIKDGFINSWVPTVISSVISAAVGSLS